MPILQNQAPATQGGTGQSTAGPTDQNNSAVVAGMNPFVKASNQHSEPAYYDNTYTITGSTAQNPAIVPIPAYGFLRSVWLMVTLTATGGTPSFAADGPFNVFSSMQLQEPNGNPIFGPDSGIGAYFDNKYGGYKYSNDAKQIYGYNVTGGNAVFFLRVPVEWNERYALGSLPNQNSAAQFQLRLGLNTIANVYSATTPPTSVTVRIQAYTDQWDQPASSELGVQNQTVPPAVGSTQFWSVQSYPIVTGLNTILLTRVGNFIRNLVFEQRNAAGARAALIDPTSLVQITLDAQPLTYLTTPQWQAYLSERTGYTGALDAAGGLDTGVLPLDFTHEFTGKLGYETGQLWIYTVTSSRFQLQFNAIAPGSLNVHTNDVILSEDIFPKV